MKNIVYYNIAHEKQKLRKILEILNKKGKMEIT